MEKRASVSGKQRSSRRRFLMTSATAAGMTALGRLATGPGVHAAGSDRIRVGLIGCGARGTGAAMQAMKADPGVRVVALADIFDDHVRSTRQKLVEANPRQAAVDDDHCFVGFDACRRVIESGVDAILIACASRFHPDYLMAGIKAGKHVFVEKPHAIDPPGVHRVMAACEEAKKKNLNVVSGLHRRYLPSVRETIQRVRDGAIGDIVAMEVSFMRAPYRVIPRDPKWSEMEWQYRTWYHFRWLSGDDVPQSLVHTIDVASWALGEVPPVNAHGLGGRASYFGPELGDVFDHNAVIYEYSSGARLYGLVRTQQGCHGEVAVKLLGTKGSAREGEIRGEKPWRYRGPRPSGHQREQEEFFAAIRAGEPINNGSYMARSTLIAILGQMAVYTGKKISYEAALNSTFRYPPGEGSCDLGSEPPVKPDERGAYPLPIPGRTKLA